MQNNNKHKKIQKANEIQHEMSTKKSNKKDKARRKKQVKIKQKKDQKQRQEQAIQAEAVHNEQQFQQVGQPQYKQGCFQDFMQANNNQEQIQNQQNHRVNACRFGTGFLYMLNIKKSYRAFNASSNKCDIHIIDGTAELNGKIYSQMFYISEQSSLILYTDSKRIEKSKTGSTIKKKGLNKNIVQISQKIHRNQLLKQLEITEQLCTYLHDYQSEQNMLLFSQESIQIKERGSQKNWDNLNVDKYVSQGQVCLLVGLKNTGKSTFCQYLLNYSEAQKRQICILDLDIGRNRLYPGSVSLSYKNYKNTVVKQDTSIWIGEYTPLNMISVYMKAVNQLFAYYKEKYYTSSLVINTMGYLTGVGELIIYEIFNVVKPQAVLLMQSNAKQQQWAVSNILRSISNGSYVQRLYFHSQNGLSVRTSTKIEKYINIYAEQKPVVDRFQPLLTTYPIKSISDLVMLLVTKKMVKLNKPINLYRNNKIGNLAILQRDELNMRIIIMGSLWRNGLFLIKGVGFGWNNSILYDADMYKEEQIQIGLINDGIDFEKTFYQINQSKMIEIQQILGHRIPYLCQNFKSLGNKGMRNNPGKKIVNRI